jgi:glycosyltransferase involved in cell wall biosynthesis
MELPPKKKSLRDRFGKLLRVGVLASHPIQYQAPWYRQLAEHVDLTVFFAHRPNSGEQGVGFGVKFTWDIDLFSGYNHVFLNNISRLPGTNRFEGCNTPGIREKIKCGSYDAFIVNGWFLKSYWQAIRACRNYCVPLLVRGDSQLVVSRSSPKHIAKRAIYPLMLRQFDAFLAVGRRNRDYLRFYSVPEEQIFDAPHFVDNLWFSRNAAAGRLRSAALRREWGATDDDVVVMFVGKLVPKKRPADIIAALRNDSPELRHCRLVFVGAGELESQLRAEAQTLYGRVAFAGFINQTALPAFYGAADVLALPSDGGETWGLVVNEAMACGIPAVVSNSCGCCPDLVQNGISGFAFDTGNINALAECLKKVVTMKTDGHDWSQDIANVLSNFTVDACTTGTLQAIRAVVRSSAAC